jgi:2',3'-cyclic-nucleotide 2'-phosphodiesterase
VFGSPGRRAVEEHLPRLREQHAIDFCVVNGENAADGRGITGRLCERIFRAGADVITLGNWTWGQRDFGGYLAAAERVLRPANMSPLSPGRGLCVAEAADGTPVAVINLLGQLSLNTSFNPFVQVEELVEEARRTTPIVLVDFHAEATSEKVAMARMLDGRVTAVLGTHTHVQTNDARVLAGGTAAVTDVGMTGPHDSVIGVEARLAIERMRTQMPVRFHPAEGDVRIEGALVECDANGRATRCELLRENL